jgi:hypothetical protein
VKKVSFAFIRQVAMIPTYHDFQSGDSGDCDMPRILAFLGWDHAGVEIRVSEVFTLMRRLQD